MYKIIKKPLISEKNSLLAEKGTYAFEVDISASKLDIKKTVEKLFRVKVSSVRTAICRGRAKRNRFGVGPVQYWKKALVQLAPGEKIAVFEGA